LEAISMRRPRLSVPLAVGLTLIGTLSASCGPRARSSRTFDEIRGLVAERPAEEVVKLLGEPDARRPLLPTLEAWTWWNYTVLDGNQYAPEVRGRIVHLEVVLRSSGDARAAPALQQGWRVIHDGVSYSFPGGRIDGRAGS
jgi:hypothetical protein